MKKYAGKMISSHYNATLLKLHNPIIRKAHTFTF